MRRLNRTIARGLSVVAILAVALLLLTGTGTAQTTSRAGLVVAHGDGRQSFVLVQFEGESIRAVELLDRSGLTVTELSFGALGIGVCAIEGTGCDVATCRQRVCQGPRPDDPFWQLFIRTDEGSWQSAPLGISSDSVPNGGVRALIWTGTDPELPAYTIEEVATRAGAVGDDGVALTRYDAAGNVLTGAEPDDFSIPVAGLVAVGLAAVLAVALVARRQALTR